MEESIDCKILCITQCLGPTTDLRPDMSETFTSFSLSLSFNVKSDSD